MHGSLLAINVLQVVGLNAYMISFRYKSMM